MEPSASQENWSGSGFLIGANLLLTNHHVLPSADLLPHTIFRFNYEENFQGEAQQPEEYRAQVDGIFQTNSALDYTVVQLVGEPGNKWGWLSLVETTIRQGERVNIIQHPSTQTVREREALLAYLGFERLSSKIKWDNSNNVFFAELVKLLTSEGKTELLSFLNNLVENPVDGINPWIGIEDQEKLRSLIANISALDDQGWEYECGGGRKSLCLSPPDSLICSGIGRNAAVASDGGGTTYSVFYRVGEVQ
ncbi:trypsin-like peptidase domain-containing protein [Coleofasciculus sp. G3-WIS-01]|uniref:trypsin-like peptidase domain-containing protein n=1 Tax=Coleofasciculus sp. G3-WIS-01 TaxID=3069528 RepID=UPI0040630CF3